MTVTDLLERILSVYPGAKPEALKAMKPVFLARLQHREAHLDSAANEVFATFQPKATKPFPIPGDFEAHLPNLQAIKSDGPPLDIKGQQERKRRLMDDWRQRQGNGIASARGKAIAAAAAHKAMEIAHMRAWGKDPQPILLSADQIQVCEDQVVSSERMATYGARVLRVEDGEAWQSQMNEIRPLVRAGRSPSKERQKRKDGEDPEIMTSPQMAKRLGELAKAARKPKVEA